MGRIIGTLWVHVYLADFQRHWSIKLDTPKSSVDKFFCMPVPHVCYRDWQGNRTAHTLNWLID
jgi:hypothetical protein